MPKNFNLSKKGFRVQDQATGHILDVQYDGHKYEGNVIIPELDMNFKLAPWNSGENPFQNDRCFEGQQNGVSFGQGWWFEIEPSDPFSSIMAEVERLSNKKSLFSFRKKTPKESLGAMVPKAHNTGFVFADATNDLGEAADTIMKSSNLMKMAYGYARRAAAAALYIQGVADEQQFQHVVAMFKSLQLQTEHSVEFQESAGAEAATFLQRYHPSISSMFIGYLLKIAMEYETPQGQLDDSQLFEEVLDMAYSEQQVSSDAAKPKNVEPRLVDYIDQRTSTPYQLNKTPLTKEEKLKEIAECVVGLTSESLCKADLELSQSSAISMVQAISQKMNDDAVVNNDSMFIAFQVVKFLADNALEHKEYDALCMFALSIVWGAKNYSEEHQSSDEKARFIGRMENEAMELLVENKKFVKPSVAKNYIEASILALCVPNFFD